MMRSKIFDNVLMEEVLIHKFIIPDYLDFQQSQIEEIDQWRETAKAKWLSDRVREVTKHSFRDAPTLNQVVYFTGFLKPVDKTFMLLKWPENKS
jgi:hypothetical protein